MQLPRARGQLSRALLDGLKGRSGPFNVPASHDDPLTGDDFHLCLYVLYELSYRGFEDAGDDFEWEPSAVSLRRDLERRFLGALRQSVPLPEMSKTVPDVLRAIAETDGGPSLADYLQSRATLAEFKEFVIHRSAYHLKESDPHSWAIPRLSGRPKAALLEIQYDEYGSGNADRIHAQLFANTMAALELDSTYGAYLDRIPGVTLASVNLMSMFGMNRSLRGAAMGHLALFEMTSSVPNRKYGNGLRRLERHGATEFFDEHVEADAVHEMIAAHDLAGSLAKEEPDLADDIVFGAAALAFYDDLFAKHLTKAWTAGRSSLLAERRVEQPIP